MQRRSFLSAAAMALLGGSSTLQAQERRAPICTPGLTPAPLDFVLSSLAGDQVSLRGFTGKILLINFWATWCVPCKIEIPAFNDLHKKYRRQGVEIIGVNVGETAAVAAPYSRTMKIGYTNLLAGTQTDILKAYDISVGLPTTIIVNRDGTACRRRVGLTRKDTFEQIIKALL